MQLAKHNQITDKTDLYFYIKFQIVVYELCIKFIHKMYTLGKCKILRELYSRILNFTILKLTYPIRKKSQCGVE